MRPGSLAFYLRLGEFLISGQERVIPIVLPAGLAIPVFGLLGLYRLIFRHSGLPAVFTIAQAMVVYGLVYATVVMVVGIDDIPRTIGLIQPLIYGACIGLVLRAGVTGVSHELSVSGAPGLIFDIN